MKHKLIKTTTAICVCVAAILTLGGIAMAGEKTGNTIVKTLVSPAMPKAIAVNDWEAKDAVREQNVISEEFKAALNAFALQTSSVILPDAEPNRNFSPLSLYYALALTAAGAEGNTQKEILGLLGLNDLTELSTQSAKLFRLLYTDNDITKLKLANSVWIDYELKVKESYLKNAQEQFYASVFSADFEDIGVSKAVSEWIAQNTSDTIAPEISLDKNTVMLIINTLYFYDEWFKAFEKDDTKEDVFYKADGVEVKCDFMHKTFGMHNYAKGEGFMRTSLDLKGQGKMTFILPDKGLDVNDFLTLEKLQSALSIEETLPAQVNVKLPKFTYGSSFKLVEMLKKLGIKEAFDDKANFLGLSDDERLYVSDVIQETHIGIDENGVEASAYTMVMIATMSMPITLPEVIDFTLDRPFIYAITAGDGTILFVGVCDDPSTK